MTDKYLLQTSESEGWWVLTDRDLGLVCKFQNQNFNSTQSYTFLEDLEQPDANELAKAVNAMANWLSVFHYDKAMAPDATDDFTPPATSGAKGIRVGAFIMPVRMTERLRIGRQVAYHRTQAGLSVRQLADRCGVVYSNISKIESGRYNVSVDILAKIASALNVQLNLT